MLSGSSAKAGAAFLAGVLVALGGAIVYLKSVDQHSHPGIQVSAQSEPLPRSVPDLTAPKPAAETPQPEPAQQEVKPAATTPTPTAESAQVPKPRISRPKLTRRPVSLAAWHPKSQPVTEAPVQEIEVPVAAQAETQTSPGVEPPPPPSYTQPAADATHPAVVPSPAAPQPRQPHTVTIPSGVNIAVRLGEKLSSDHNFTGDTFRATLDAPIISEGFIIADKGAKVLGRIVKAQKAGKFEGLAELQLTLTQIATTDGQRMQVETNDSLRKGASNADEEVLKMGGGAALGAIIGAIAGGGKGAAIGAGAGGAAGAGAVLLGHGKPAVIDNETRLSFTLSAPTTLTEKLN